MVDMLLRHVEKLHSGRWHRVLDAGTGRSSLSWLCSLSCQSWTAVTAEKGRAEVLSRDLGSRFRPQDRLVVGNWTDPTLLQGEQFDEVIADYLLGSVERYAPYAQLAVLDRLLQMTRHRLYLTGLEPYGEAQTEAEGLIGDLARFRDACHLLCRRRSHRELPLQSVLRRLAEKGAPVLNVLRFANHYGEDFLRTELRGVEQIVSTSSLDESLRLPLLGQCQSLLSRGLNLLSQGRALVCSFDYLVVVGADEG